MITLVDAVPLLSVPTADTQYSKALTGDFGQLLSEVQDATSVADGHTPASLEALESVLQTLADILQPLTLSLEPAPSVPGSTDNPETSLAGSGSVPVPNGVPQSVAPLLLLTDNPETSLAGSGSVPNGVPQSVAPLRLLTDNPETLLAGSGSVPNGVPQSVPPLRLLTVSPGDTQSPLSTLPLPEEHTQATTAALHLPRPLESGEAKQDSAPTVSEEEASPEDHQETASVAVQATLAALLTAQGALQTVAPPRLQVAAAGTQTSDTQPAGGGVPPLPVSAPRLQTQSRVIDSALPVETTFSSRLDTNRTSQTESSVPFSAVLQTFDGALAPVATRSQPGESSPALAGTGFVEPADGEQALDLAPLLAAERPHGQQAVLTPSLAETRPTVSSPPDEPPAGLGEASRATVLRETIAPSAAADTADSSAPAATTARDTTQPLPGDRPRHDAAVQALPVPPPVPPEVPLLSRVTLPDQLPTGPEGLSDMQLPTGTRARPEDLPEALPEQTPSALPGTSEARLFSAGSPVGSTAPRPQDPSRPPPLSAPDGPPPSPPWRLPMASNTVLLHIDPPEFGPLLVHVRLQDKRLIASFQAESPEIEAILRANLPALHASLSQQGFEVQPIALSLATDGFSTALNNGSGSFSQQQSTFHAFTQEQPGTDAEQRRNDPEPERLFSEPRPSNHRLIDVVI